MPESDDRFERPADGVAQGVGLEAGRVRTQQDERVLGAAQQLGAGSKQDRQLFGQLPSPPAPAVPVTGRIEHDPVVPAAPPQLAADELEGVVLDPADRRPLEPRELRVPPRPRHGRPGRVDVRDRRPGLGRDQ